MPDRGIDPRDSSSNLSSFFEGQDCVGHSLGEV
jgi:hypothetical protein